MTLVIRDAATGELQAIVSNRVHPFFVSFVAPNVHLMAHGLTLRGTLTSGRFIEAQDIEPGAWLITEASFEAEVVAKTIAATPLLTYNLSVDEFETYFVAGADNDNAPAVWVRNCSKLSYLHTIEAILERPAMISSISKMSTDDIINSLIHGKQPILVDVSTGKIWNGNTRVYVLEERGYDKNRLIPLLEKRHHK